ncbi:TraB/GumN family protein [Candidatus Woesearchaeota archaeon]|nr:TraB/GumN family protein [Candidatus Woesearchaeota archaeon]
MYRYKNLTILGTSHIAKQSVIEVKKAINTIKPKIIALELDKDRFLALTSKKKKSSIIKYRDLSFQSILFNLIGSYIEKKLSKKTGFIPGSDMKTAIKVAKTQNIKVELIDQPIQITLNKLTSQITRKEKLSLIKEIIFFPFVKNKTEFDLNKVPSTDIIEKLIKETQEKYPTIHRILVKERNLYMAKALYKIINTNQDKKILAIVGAGHKKEIIGELKSIKN